MTSITVNLTDTTAKKLRNRKHISEQDFLNMLNENIDKIDNDFMDYDEFKQIIAIQRIAKQFGFFIANENKLLQIKDILQNEKIFA